MYRRFITPQLRDALADSPVVLVNGARQTGKTTLVQGHPESLGLTAANYLSLDEPDVLAAAVADPGGFLTGLSAGGGTLILDEVQQAPSLFPVIKTLVDRDRRPGRFLLTGSANVLLLPKVSESLAGRMEILTLWPLAQAEIAAQGTSGLIDRLFDGESPLAFSPADVPATGLRTDVLRRALLGGYPEPLGRASTQRRQAWFNAYLTTILQRDVRDIANIEGLTQLPRLLALLASRAAGLLNAADISRTAGIPYTTLQRYLALLETTFLVQLLPAWSSNLGSRMIKSPKVLLTDTGLAASLIGLTEERLMLDGSLAGPLVENFVGMELLKQMSWSKTGPQLFHWRTAGRQEVDLLLEAPDGRLVGIEVKASTTVSASDFAGLRTLSEMTGKRFVCGVVLHTGERVLPFGPDLFALPISTLWG